MPTFDATHWRSHRPGHFFAAAEPITVLDDSGALIAVCHELLDLIAEHDAVLASGHLSVEEGIPLVRAARGRGIRCVITHASFWWPIEAQREITAMGGWLEQCTIAAYHENGDAAFAAIAAQVAAVGPEHIVLATDLGQAANPDPPDGFALWLDRFLQNGFSPDEVGRMAREHPAELLG